MYTKQLTQQQPPITRGCQDETSPTPQSLSASIRDINDRIVSCHEYITNIEDRLNGPTPKQIGVEANPADVTGIHEALAWAQGKSSYLENRLVSLLEKF